MYLGGRKVLSVDPGVVQCISYDPMRYSYCVVINGGTHVGDSNEYLTASAAKQAMREEVARLRRIHKVEG